MVVTFEANFLARSYIEETSLHWPVLVDENCELYHAYSMLEASFWDVWGARTIFKYIKELLKGNRAHYTGGDVMQRGGDVLIDPQGNVRLHHVGSGPGDRPAVGTILDIIAQ